MGQQCAPASCVGASTELVTYCLQVAGKEDDWFVYKVPKGQAAAGETSEALMSDTVNVGRHTITEVRL